MASAACRHAAPVVADLPAGWQLLVATPSSFAALYRLECCGQRNLLATVRSGAGQLRLTVAAGPAGIVADAWLTRGDGWLTRDHGRCVTPVDPRGLQIAKGRRLPLDPVTAAIVLSGRVAEGAMPVVSAPGWVALDNPGFSCYRWRVTGFPAVVTEVEVGRTCGEESLRAALSGHHGRVPGRIVLASGDEHAVLELVEWKPAPTPEAPTWLDAPVCDDGS